MTLQESFTTLKDILLKTTCDGDFLLANNAFSHQWFYTGSWNTREGIETIQTILTNFWANFLRAHSENYVMLTLEYLEQPGEHEFPISRISRQVAEKLAHPRLAWEKILIDPDSFELYMEQWPTDANLVIFNELSTRFDLLHAVCNNLQAMDCNVTTILTVVERDPATADALRKILPHTDCIPFFVYNEAQRRLLSLLDMQEAPYLQYQPYFQTH